MCNYYYLAPTTLKGLNMSSHPECSDWRQVKFKVLIIKVLSEKLEYLLPRALARG